MLGVDEVFVFGSNLAGRHGKGAALHAAEKFGAAHGVSEGLTGSAYAIPTKDANLRTLPLSEVTAAIGRFCDFARARPGTRFLVTPIGTGLAGIPKRDIWAAFHAACIPPNCVLTSSWVCG